MERWKRGLILVIRLAGRIAWSFSAEAKKSRKSLRREVAELKTRIAHLESRVDFQARRAGPGVAYPVPGIGCVDPCAADADGDADGIPDCADPCPGNPDNDCAQPCPLDADGDGQRDCIDPCRGARTVRARSRAVLPARDPRRAQADSPSGREQAYDEAEDQAIRRMVEQQIQQESNAFYATARVWDDGIVDPRGTRTVLGIALSAAVNNVVRGGDAFGVFRM